MRENKTLHYYMKWALMLTFHVGMSICKRPGLRQG